MDSISVSRRLTDPGASAHGDGRVHVAFSIDTMSVGGTEMNAVRIAERLDRERFRLSVVTLRGEGPLTERYERLGVPVHRFPIRNLYGANTVRQGRRLARFFRDERVAVVHCHDQYSNFFSTLSARFAGVPVVIASKRRGPAVPQQERPPGPGSGTAGKPAATGTAVHSTTQRR